MINKLLQKLLDMVRIASPSVKAQARKCYIDLLNTSESENQIEHYQMLTALRLSENSKEYGQKICVKEKP